MNNINYENIEESNKIATILKIASDSIKNGEKNIEAKIFFDKMLEKYSE